MKITNKRWNEAQDAEREFHNKQLAEEGFESVKAQYAQNYAYYFKYLGLDPEQHGKTIIEIGCADFPALEYCYFEKGYLVEPLPSKILKDTVEDFPNLELIQAKCEDVELPKADEVWLFNVLQHVQDPDLFIKRCKDAAEVIRFFEPIDWPIEIYHPHTFGFGDFVSWFGDCCKRYEGTVPEFHAANCAFGVWKR